MAKQSSLPTFDDLFSARKWKPIANCPGRYRLLGPYATMSPAALVGRDVEVAEYKVHTARDIVLVVELVNGGIISYRKPDGTHLHTLNTQVGFVRKLSQLRIDSTSRNSKTADEGK